ncbi:MAG: uncharacterized protein JWO48_858 [Bryobacterales bacterium]|nr:uncharacterized protein [Bryobacterales bacterium]
MMPSKHVDVHTPWRSWSEEQLLHVAVAYSNPVRWTKRRLLMNDFREHMRASANVVLHVGELAYGDRPFEVTGEDANDVQLRTSHELWHKENILNLAVQRFPPDWRYGAVIDGDFHMTRRDWALEAVHQLQHYDFVQLFSSYSDLSSQHRPFRVMASFAFNYVNGGANASYRAMLRKAAAVPYGYYGGQPATAAAKPMPWAIGATGGAWAFRRSAFDAVGGLLDSCILGSADWHMAFGLVGATDGAAELQWCSKPYVDSVLRWQKRAAVLKQNIGYINNHAVHYFHGSKVSRAYGSRWRILLDNNYDPRTDISRDWQGAYQLTGNKPRLRDQIRAYFRERNEDSMELSGQERHIV